MTTPEFQSYFLPILELSATGEISIQDAVERMCDHFQLTDEEREERTAGGSRTKVHDRVAWANAYLYQAKLIKRPKRGFFTSTDRGETVLRSKPKRIDRDFLMQFEEFVDFQSRKRKPKQPQNEPSSIVPPSESTPEDLISSAYNEISTQVQSELLDRVLNSTPMFFEKLIVNLLVAMGYGGSIQQAGEHLGKSGDNGVDGVINEDKLGLDLIYVQAKRYAPENSVGRPDIQRFAGSLMGFGAHKGVFVTTSSFSTHAIEYADQVQQRIILIDGDKLTDLMLENNVGTRVERTVEIKKIDEDFFE